jgi:site-specific DNA-methyltransferase (adenine-specific)
MSLWYKRLVKGKKNSSRNRSITLSKNDRKRLSKGLTTLHSSVFAKDVVNKVIHQDFFQVVDFLPSQFVDLLFVDPPYNISKKFRLSKFRKMGLNRYTMWMESWIEKLVRLLKPTASIYICGDWRSSGPIHHLCEKYFRVRNRITFEREKGRGSRNNWKNNSEDIWFCTVSKEYTFNVNDVKLKRRVIAPYREKGRPKDWTEEGRGKFRLTHPSNIWTDITIPFWSMSENTLHPTQKPEKLLAKIILASSNEGDMILDPFAGVGTTGVVAKKLKRNFVLIEIDRQFCLLALKRLELAAKDSSIQGYAQGIFLERNVRFPLFRSTDSEE